MISLENVSVYYKSSERPALKDISLSFQKGDFVCVLGKSGAGKSTFIRSLNGLQPVSTGSVLWNGRAISTLSEREVREIRRETGMIFQHFNLIPRLSVYQNIMTGFFGYKSTAASLLGLFSAEEKRKAGEMIEAVELNVEHSRKVEHLSGGQKQRVAIARALVQDPEVFLGDEPVASLDPGTADRIFQILKKNHSARNLLTIINVHDVLLAKKYASRLIALKEGKVVFDGPPNSLTDEDYEMIYRG
ncbi:phosphonate ABC transporter ATP-binding protein [Fictibacillus aquaticus]|uniref:Phosphonate ABC transporter ATP-binding protein n=1 Tax=Fictibacillus aquaticus TaxID=2021314 RepID=A0A235FCU1_9BACL|nr:phosphonate ABC transporter ATP-binding protein [Fictibacillus aquaticus]OYD58743.1 phosphonate ABC transporter ATP-binding protein [Fictibacillus aquaticus]